LATSQLPTLGDGSEMTSSNERRLGDRIAREIYRDPDYLDDPVLADYVQGIWQPLLAAARLRGDLSPELDERFAWEIMLGRDRTVNAFALPGGYLGVHLGLIAVVSNRDELASVLGHELSHVTQRHISRLMAKQSQQTPWMIGAMILGALAASKNADTGNALILGGQAVAAQNQLNFSRDMEREADRVGYGVMTQAGFAPEGFVTMFEKLQQASRLNDNGAFPYLRSHPLSSERMADMQSRQPLDAPRATPVEPTLEHAMLAARARVLANSGVDALRATVAEAAPANLATLSPARQAGVLYGAALAASRLRDVTDSKDFVQRLSMRVQADPPALRWARLLQAELALATNDLSGATNALAALPSGSARPELFLGAMAAVRSGQSAAVDAASQRLQAWVVTHPNDAQAWQLLASAYTAQGQTLRAIRAEAEVQVARLDYPAALDRFRAAQDWARRASAGAAQNIEAAIIDTRQRQVAQLLKEQTLDK
jgi:predicted Zn-dependent protease